MRIGGHGFGLLLVLVGGIVGGLISSKAGAERDGLFAEAHVEVDMVTVRRVRDTSNGNVCYVASVHSPGDHVAKVPAVSIACVR